MSEKRVPERMCVVCRKMKPKTKLVKVVKNADGITVDATLKLPGRGAWICPECISAAKKKRALNRAFKCPVSDEVYDSLENVHGK